MSQPETVTPVYSWAQIIRLGLVQAALGSMVVLTTSTINRVMVIELAWAAAVPGALVGLHYAIQLLRPRMGYGSDCSGRRTPWILGGLTVLMLGSLLAACSVWLSQGSDALGLLVSVFAFALIGAGVSASGTALLVMIAKGAGVERRAPAATIVWIMMILGFIVTTAIVGQLLDPYSAQRLVLITAVVGLISLGVAALALLGLEPPVPAPDADVRGSSTQSASASPGFRESFAAVWQEPLTRKFAFFVFVSMLAYSAQDLILEPFAGIVFSMTPGQTTSLSSLQHSGVLVGMILVAIAAGGRRGRRRDTLWLWAIGGCAASALALFGLAAASVVGAHWPITANVFFLGLANGAYAVAAIASMMSLVSQGRRDSDGLRMGTFGAAQALAFGLGGFAGAFASDLAVMMLASPALGYGVVFAIEATLFLASGFMAWRLAHSLDARSTHKPQPGGMRPLPSQTPEVI